jgi:glucose/arabinose dehydrogenase
VLDKIPAAKFRAGCRIAFGPDGKLYITTGDSLDRQLAQDLDSLAGKILRINADGSIPNDNPFDDSAVWSYGHRNPQGIAWDDRGQLYSSEHGPSVIDGPRGGDEVNKIIKGANYGWPLVSHEKTLEGTEPALEVFTPAEAPASLLIYSGNELPQFSGNLFFGALVGEGIVRMIPSGDEFTIEKIHTDYGRIREVTQGPDGLIYFTTSNRDGRGNPNTGDDKIYRLRPEE